MRLIYLCLCGSLLPLFTAVAATVAAAPSAPKLMWSARYSPPGAHDCDPRALAVGPDNSIYLTGISRNDRPTDITTLRYSERGQLLWAAHYDGPLQALDSPSALAVDGDGNVYVTGVSVGGSGSYDCVTIKYSQAGEQLWVSRYDGEAHGQDGGAAIRIAEDQSVYVAGSTYAGEQQSADALLIKYSSEGNQQWAVTRNGPASGGDAFGTLALAPNGAIYLAGQSNWNAGPADFLIARYETDGSETWYREFDGSTEGDASAISVKADPSGNVIVTGFTTRTATAQDFTTVKYTADGELLWSRILDGEAHEYDAPGGLEVHSDGTIYVAGIVTDRPSDYDVGAVKYGPDGSLLWTARYRGAGRREDECRSLAVDGSGSLYLTGGTRVANQYDILTLKFAPDGRNLWSARFGSSSSEGDMGNVVAVDHKRSVVVAGQYAAGQNYQFVTLKYSGSNGAPTANAGPDQTLTSPTVRADVQLDAGTSSDPDGDQLTYRWRSGNALLAGGKSVTLALSHGKHVISLEVEDPYGARSRDQVRVTVVAPSSTPDAGISGSGTIAASGGEAAFTINARTVRNGRAAGTLTANRPDGSRIKAKVQSLVLIGGSNARVYGQFRTGRRVVSLVADLQDLGEPGAGVDTFRLETGDGTEAINGTLMTGNVAITP